MKAIWNDTVIAESDDTEIVEGNHYFPFDSIKSEYFSKSELTTCLLYTSPSPRDRTRSRMPSSA